MRLLHTRAMRHALQNLNMTRGLNDSANATVHEASVLHTTNATGLRDAADAVARSLVEVEEIVSSSVASASTNSHASFNELARPTQISFLLLVVVVAMMLFCFLTFVLSKTDLLRDPSGKLEGKEDPDLMAWNLRRNVRKYPVSSRKLQKSGGTKDRYIAILPHDNLDIPQGCRTYQETSIIEKWKDGKVAWWDDLASFSRREPSKGDLKLKSIVTATGGCKEKHELCEVEVSYTGDNGSKNEIRQLLFLLPTQEEAAEWAKKFNTFMQQVRPHSRFCSTRCFGNSFYQSGERRLLSSEQESSSESSEDDDA